MTKDEAIIAAFAATARPVMLKYLGGDRQTCIASTRLTIETMRCLGLDAAEVPVQLLVQCKAMNFAYISGFSAKARARMQRKAGKPITTKGAGGFNGHLLAAVAGRWIIDSSLDQIHTPELGIVVSPCTVVMPIPEDAPPLKLNRLSITAKGLTDGGQEIDIKYRAIENYTFRTSAAWEFCVGMKYVVAQIIDAMMAGAV